MRRAAVFPFIAIPSLSIRIRRGTLASLRLRFTATKCSPYNREPKGSCRQHFDAGKMNLVVDCDYNEAGRAPTNSFRRRIAEVCLVRGIGRRIVEHAVDCRRERLKFYDS